MDGVVHKISDIFSLLDPEFDYAVIYVVSYIYLRQLLCPPYRGDVDTTDTMYRMLTVYKGFVYRSTTGRALCILKKTSSLRWWSSLPIPDFLLKTSVDCFPDELQGVVSGSKIECYNFIVLVFTNVDLWQCLATSYKC